MKPAYLARFSHYLRIAGYALFVIYFFNQPSEFRTLLFVTAIVMVASGVLLDLARGWKYYATRKGRRRNLFVGNVALTLILALALCLHFIFPNNWSLMGIMIAILAAIGWGILGLIKNKMLNSGINTDLLDN